MVRADIIAAIGRQYLHSNIENDEYSYPKAYKQKSLSFKPIVNSKGRKYENIDIRFVKDKSVSFFILKIDTPNFLVSLGFLKECVFSIILVHFHLLSTFIINRLRLVLSFFYQKDTPLFEVFR